MLALRRQNERLLAILRLLVVLIKVLGISLEWRRVTDGDKKQLLLRAIERSRSVLSLRAALRVLKLSVRLKAKVGELTMEIELLNEKIDILERETVEWSHRSPIHVSIHCLPRRLQTSAASACPGFRPL